MPRSVISSSPGSREQDRPEDFERPRPVMNNHPPSTLLDKLNHITSVNK